MQKYQKNFNTKKTSQREAIPGREKEMAKNYAGGVVFKLDKWKMLDRFLILGSSESTYYASSKKLTKDNAKNILVLIYDDAKRVVDRIVEISHEGRAPNNDPALFALAMVAGLAKDVTDRKYALDNLNKVARIGTHLFHFVEYVQGFRGWGRGLRKGIANWYLDKGIDKLAHQVVKYQGRDGWTHRDVLRKTHVKIVEDNEREDIKTILAWAARGIGSEQKIGNKLEKTFPYTIDDVKNIDMIYGFELAKKADTENEIVKLIKTYNLPREAVPTQFMGKKVYEALLPTMPMTALIRNLGNLSKHDILSTGNFDDIQFVTDKIVNPDNLRKARVHPIQLLIALKTYAQGRGVRGNGEWNVVPQIVDALDEAFYLSFKNITPTNKKILIGLDVSGSMDSYHLQAAPMVSARAASAAMAMVTMKTEKKWSIVGFTGGSWFGRSTDINNLMELDLTPRMRMDDIINKVNCLSFGATDCALPAIWAKEKNRDYDAIIIYTDSETWQGNIQPVQAMKEYRDKVGHDVKMIVVGMTSTGFTIADSNDPSMLDVVGFDTAAPNIMSDFISNKL